MHEIENVSINKNYNTCIEIKQKDKDSNICTYISDQDNSKSLQELAFDWFKDIKYFIFNCTDGYINKNIDKKTNLFELEKSDKIDEKIKNSIELSLEQDKNNMERIILKTQEMALKVILIIKL